MKRVVVGEESIGKRWHFTRDVDAEIPQRLVEEPVAIERVCTLIEVVSRDDPCAGPPA